MDKSKELLYLIKRLNRNEDFLKIGEELKGFLKKMEREPLSRIEQSLIKTELTPEILIYMCSAHNEVFIDKLKLNHLCSTDVKMLPKELERMKKKLKSGHVMNRMVKEHEIILDYLKMIQSVVMSVDEAADYCSVESECKELRELLGRFDELEAHFKREEEIIFSELERRGVTGPPAILKNEHVRFRKGIQDLTGLIEKEYNPDYASLGSALKESFNQIDSDIRTHIFKENNILYPAIYEVFKDNTLWEKMESENYSITGFIAEEK